MEKSEQENRPEPRKASIPPVCDWWWSIFFDGYSSYMMRKGHWYMFEDKLWGDKFWSEGHFYRSVGMVTKETMKHYIEECQDKNIGIRYKNSRTYWCINLFGKTTNTICFNLWIAVLLLVLQRSLSDEIAVAGYASTWDWFMRQIGYSLAGSNERRRLIQVCMQRKPADVHTQ